MLLKKVVVIVESEDLNLREEVHVERSKCGGVGGRRKGLLGRAEGLSIEKRWRIHSAPFHSCCEERRQQAVNGSLQSIMEDAGVVSLKMETERSSWRLLLSSSGQSPRKKRTEPES